MYFENIQQLLNFENNDTLPAEPSEWNGIYGLRIAIRFSLHRLSDEEFKIVCNFIDKYPTLHELYLPYMNVNMLGGMDRLKILCDTICRCKVLESLNLYGIDIENPEYLRYFNQILSEGKNLKLLNLSWFSSYKLTIKDMQEICDSISSCPNLKDISLFSTGIDKLTPICFQLLCSAIKRCSRLQSLELAQRELNLLSTEHFAMSCATITESKTIKNCNIRDVRSGYSEERWNTIKGILKKKQNLLTEPSPESTQILFYLSHQNADASVNNADDSVDKEEHEYKIKKQRTCNPLYA